MEDNKTNSKRMEEGSLKASNLPPKAWDSEMTVSVTGEPPTDVEEGIAIHTDIEIIPEIIEPLSLPDVLRISAVLEDTTDQLSILNYIMPVQYERRLSMNMKSKEMNSEGKSLDKLPMVSTISKVPKEGPKLPEIRQKGLEFNKMQDLIFKTPTKQSIITTETLKKIQIDRQFLSDVIANAITELQDSGTFTNLLSALSKEKENKMHFYDVIAREENGRKKIKSLQKQLVNVKKEWQFEVQKLEEKLEFWMEKYDKDTEMKQNELNALKAAKASDLARLQEYAKMIREYEQVIIEDRIEKEKCRKKIEQDILELKSIIKLQSWWRGTVVRREIGAFKLPKDKEDSKDSKGKGKDKDKRKGKK
ncbi:dynein regulatory complex protein 9 isoform X3 [Lemur catta]|uniref:dynein regulatory complex protein 9 isoform X3 n=1 Tax=Lemur catta TaxID=9447 RepID=UPI001E26998D|nr:dynein regulatory complex protein 9 isoform X3 [Lemur catta]